MFGLLGPCYPLCLAPASRPAPHRSVNVRRSMMPWRRPTESRPGIRSTPSPGATGLTSIALRPGTVSARRSACCPVRPSGSGRLRPRALGPRLQRCRREVLLSPRTQPLFGTGPSRGRSAHAWRAALPRAAPVWISGYRRVPRSVSLQPVPWCMPVPDLGASNSSSSCVTGRGT